MTAADFGLYRESIGSYLFAGRPEVYFNARLTPTERALLEFHEHNHWMLAHASTYGKEQIALVEASRLMTDELIAEELRRCCEVTVGFSRLVYEGLALVAEKTYVQALGLSTQPDWFSLLQIDEYGEGQRVFDSWLGRLPYAPEVRLSIATNTAELCLNCISILDDTRSDRDPISARDPMTLHAEDLRILLRAGSPDSLLRSLSDQLAVGTGTFVQLVDDRANEILSKEGLKGEALRVSDALSDLNAVTNAKLTYAIYESLRAFAEATGAIANTREYALVQGLFDTRCADWLTRAYANDINVQAHGIRVAQPLGG